MSRIVSVRGVKDTSILRYTLMSVTCTQKQTCQDCYVLPDDNVIDTSLDEPLVDKNFKVYSQPPHNPPQALINSNYADSETALVLVYRVVLGLDSEDSHTPG